MNDTSGATTNQWIIGLKYNTIFIFILCLLDGTGHRLGQTCWQRAIQPGKRYMNGSYCSLTDNSFVGRWTCLDLFPEVWCFNSSSRCSSCLLNSPWVAKNCFICSIHVRAAGEFILLALAVASWRFTGVKSNGAKIWSDLVGVDVAGLVGINGRATGRAGCGVRDCSTVPAPSTGELFSGRLEAVTELLLGFHFQQATKKDLAFFSA